MKRLNTEAKRFRYGDLPAKGRVFATPHSVIGRLSLDSERSTAPPPQLRLIGSTSKVWLTPSGQGNSRCSFTNSPTTWVTCVVKYQI